MKNSFDIIKKNTKAICILASSVLFIQSPPLMAKTTNFNIGFVTIQDLSITQSNALTFGQTITGIAGKTCTISKVFSGAVNTAVATTAAHTDGVSGDGCLTTNNALNNNLSGVYAISGEVNQAITLTLAPTTNANFTFTPNGQIFGAATAPSSGTIVFSNTPTSSTLDASGDSIVIVMGNIVIGGTDLTPNTPYSQTFDITATY